MILGKKPVKVNFRNWSVIVVFVFFFGGHVSGASGIERLEFNKTGASL